MKVKLADLELDMKSEPKRSAVHRTMHRFHKFLEENESINEKDLIIDDNKTVGSTRVKINIDIFEIKLSTNLNEKEFETSLKLISELYRNYQSQMDSSTCML